MIPARFVHVLAAVFVLITSLTALAAPSERAVEAMDTAMAAVRAGNWDTALSAAEEAGPVARDIVEWHRLRAGRGKYDDLTAFLERRPDWPGLAYMLRRSEGTVPYRARARDVAEFFAANPPQTGAGMIVYAAANESLGRDSLARDQIIAAWGTHGAHLDRGPEVEMLIRSTGVAAHHLGLTKQGHPRHPLYLGYTVQPEPWI